jgi:hypothetical protein
VNYDQPRQHKDGGWHYTQTNDDRIWPIGYCRGHGPHGTEDEARRCYRDYELNERLRLDGTLGSWNPCEYRECQTLTNRAAFLGGWTCWRLCDEHRTKECCAELYGELAGDSVHS